MSSLPTIEQIVAPLEAMCQRPALSPTLAAKRARILAEVEHSIFFAVRGAVRDPDPSAAPYFAAWQKRGRFASAFLPTPAAGYQLVGGSYTACVRHLVKTERGLYVVRIRLEDENEADAVLTYAQTKLMQSKYRRAYRRASLVLKENGKSTWNEYYTELADQQALEHLIGIYEWTSRWRPDHG